MSVLEIIFVGLLIAGILLSIFEAWRSKRFLKNMAEKNSFEKIDMMIDSLNRDIANYVWSLNHDKADILLDYLDFWKQVKRYKEKNHEREQRLDR